MEEEISSIPPLKRTFNWIDLVIILGGIIFIYVFLAYGTFWAMKHWPYERVLIYMNAFATQLSFVLLIWTVKKVRHWEWADFGWKAVPIKGIPSKVVSLYFLTWIINISYAIFLYQYGFNPPETDVYSKLLGQATWLTLILNLVLAGLFAPFVEETLFRGIIFGSLQAYFGKWTSAVLSAGIFSALHLQAYGFIPRFMLGMVLVYLYDRYKSLYPAIALHAINNIVATLISVSLPI